MALRKQPEQREQCSTATLLAYSLPLVGASHLLFFVHFYFLKFATDELLLAPAGVGLLFGLSKVWDALSDPLVGHWSDRTETRLGRRRPWMWASLLPLAGSFTLLWVPPPGIGASALLAWEGALLLAFYTALTAYLVPHASLGIELAGGTHQRTRLFGARHVTWTLGLFTSFAAIQIVDRHEQPGDAASLAALLMAGVAVALLAITPAAVREPGVRGSGGSGAMRRAVHDVWNNPHARLLLAVWFIDSLGVGVVGVLAPFMAEYVLARPDLIGVIPAIYVGAGVLSVPAWVSLARRWGRKPTWLAAMLVTALAFGGTIAAGAGDVRLLCALMVMAGCGMGCGGAVGAAMLTDVIDFDERRTGERKEGIYSAAWGFVLKLAVGLVTAWIGFSLQWVGFVPNQPQDQIVLWTLTGLFGGVPCVAFLLGAVLFSFFSLPEPTSPAAVADEDRAGPATAH